MKGFRWLKTGTLAWRGSFSHRNCGYTIRNFDIMGLIGIAISRYQPKIIKELLLITKGNNMGSYISINGKSMFFSGGNIVVNGDRVIIDGKEIDMGEQKTINITVEGNAGDISGDFEEIKVRGVVQSVLNKNGSIVIEGDVHGNVENKNGNISIMGSVFGDAETKNGNIRHR